MYLVNIFTADLTIVCKVTIMSSFQQTFSFVLINSSLLLRWLMKSSTKVQLWSVTVLFISFPLFYAHADIFKSLRQCWELDDIAVLKVGKVRLGEDHRERKCLLEWLENFFLWEVIYPIIVYSKSWNYCV